MKTLLIGLLFTAFLDGSIMISRCLAYLEEKLTSANSRAKKYWL
jgi:hypothetical protein